MLSLDLIAELVEQYGINNLSMFFMEHWETIYLYVVLAYTADNLSKDYPVTKTNGSKSVTK